LVVSAAAGAVLDIINPSLLARVRETGRYLMEQLSVLKAKHSCIREVRGVGLMAGIELDFPGKEIVQWCQEKGLLINCTQDTVIRFLPPLIIDKKDVDFAVRLVNDALQQKSA
jgi:acetylornithine/succinyldiaminopimelate/putrescine aminotransferase